MLNVTDKAKKELKKLLQSHARDRKTGIRLACSSRGRVGLLLSDEKSGDQVIRCDDLKVLLVGNEFTPLLDGVTIDVINSGPKREFVMTKNLAKQRQETNVC